MDQTKVGQYLTNLRLKKEFSQEQVAGLLSVSVNDVQGWETGEVAPDINSLMTLAKLYSVSVDDILSGGVNKTNTIQKQPKEVKVVNTTGSMNTMLFPIVKIAASFIILISFFFAFYSETIDLGGYWGDLSHTISASGFNVAFSSDYFFETASIGAILLFLGNLVLLGYAIIAILDQTGNSSIIKNKKTGLISALIVLGVCFIGMILIVVETITFGVILALLALLAYIGITSYELVLMNK